MASSARSSEAEDRRAAAYHEAGHAVAAYHLGDPGDIEHVSIFPPDNQGHTGFIKLAPIADRHLPNNERKVRARLTVLMAGRAAEEKATGKDCPGAARGDIDEAFPLYIDAGFGDATGTHAEDGTINHRNDESLYNEWLEQARAFMKNPDRWAEVEALKDQLLISNHLTGAQVDDVIRSAQRNLIES